MSADWEDFIRRGFMYGSANKVLILSSKAKESLSSSYVLHEDDRKVGVFSVDGYIEGAFGFKLWYCVMPSLDDGKAYMIDADYFHLDNLMGQ